MSKGRWKWILAWINGFGEVAFQVDPDVWKERDKHRRLTIRRLTLLLAGPKGIQLARWIPFAKIDGGSELVSGEEITLETRLVGIVAKPSRKLEDGLLETWTSIVTSTPGGLPPGRRPGGNDRGGPRGLIR